MTDQTVDKLEWLAEYRQDFLNVGLALEATRDAWRDLWKHNAIRSIAYADVPPQFNPHPFPEGPFVFDCRSYVLRLAIMERLARYDASALLALPSPSLCAGLVSHFCCDVIQRRFFERFWHLPTWAFFAATEPHVGSDLSKIATSLECSGGVWRLNGCKTMVGNAARADIGIVLARGSSNPCFVILEPKASPSSIQVSMISTVGLSGIELCSVTIKEHTVLKDDIIGLDAGVKQNGITAIGRLLLMHRPLVAAMAIGTGRGILDLLAEAGVSRSILAPFTLEHCTLLRRQEWIGHLHEESRLCQHDASLFKLQATDFARRVASIIPKVMNAGDLVTMPFINKKYRDSFAFEYMEGPLNIHRLASYHSYLAGEGR